MIIGAHQVSPSRSYSVNRFSGLLTVLGTFAFAAAILTTQGKIISTPGWAPVLDWANGYLIVGGILMLSGVLGVAGLAFDDDDAHRLPRILSLTSALIGVLWFGVAAFAFCVAYGDGWVNSGPFLAIPAAILHANRLWLLSEFPQ